VVGERNRDDPGRQKHEPKESRSHRRHKKRIRTAYRMSWRARRHHHCHMNSLAKARVDLGENGSVLAGVCWRGWSVVGSDCSAIRTEPATAPKSAAFKRWSKVRRSVHEKAPSGHPYAWCHDEWRAKKKPRSGDTQYGAKYPGTNTPCRGVQTLARLKLTPHEEAPGAESTGAPALLEG